MLFVLVNTAERADPRFQMSIDFSTLPTVCALSFEAEDCRPLQKAERVQTCLRMACTSRSAWVEGSAQKHSFLRHLSECRRCRIGPSGSRAGPNSFFAANLQRRGEAKSPKASPRHQSEPLVPGVRSRQLNRGKGDGTHGRTVAEGAVPGLDGPRARLTFPDRRAEAS